MLIVAAHAHLPRVVHARQHPAAYAAVGAGRSDGLHQEASARASSCWLPTHTLPFSTFTGQARTACSLPSHGQPSRRRIRCLYSGEITTGSPPTSPNSPRDSIAGRAARLAVVQGVDPIAKAEQGNLPLP